jgi:hypothetical protein
LLVFETGMALLFGVAAIWPSALIELSRKLSPPAQIRLTPIGTTAGIFLFVLALVRGLSAVGWFLRRRWGWLLTMVVIAIQILRSIGNAASGDLAQGLFGATSRPLSFSTCSSPTFAPSFLRRRNNGSRT